MELKEKSVEILRVIDKIEKIGKQKVIDELTGFGVSYDKIETIIKFIEISGISDEKIEKLRKLDVSTDLYFEGVNELEEVINKIRKYKVPEKNFTVDLTIARGLDYYTGTVYETFLNDYKKIGSVCSGGRYDNLAENYTEKKLPGVGISIGLTRFFYQMKKENILENISKSISKVLILPMSENEIEYALEVASIFRNENINTEVFLEDKKIKSKFKYADKLNIPYVIVLGEDEEKSNMVTLKDMCLGEQITCDIGKILNKIKGE